SSQPMPLDAPVTTATWLANVIATPGTSVSRGLHCASCISRATVPLWDAALISRKERSEARPLGKRGVAYFTVGTPWTLHKQLTAISFPRRLANGRLSCNNQVRILRYIE